MLRKVKCDFWGEIIYIKKKKKKAPKDIQA